MKHELEKKEFESRLLFLHNLIYLYSDPLYKIPESVLKEIKQYEEIQRRQLQLLDRGKGSK